MPRLIFFYLESVVLNKRDYGEQNQYHKKVMKIIKNLLHRTADSALYIISGQFPESKIQDQILITLGSILKNN